MTKANLFGKGRDGDPNAINNWLNPFLALILAFFAIRTQWIAVLMQQFLPRVSMMMLIILMFLLLLAVFSSGTLHAWAVGLIVGLCVIGFIYSLTAGTGVLEEIGLRTGWLYLDERDIPLVIVLSVTGLVIWAVAGSHKKYGKTLRGEEWGK